MWPIYHENHQKTVKMNKIMNFYKNQEKARKTAKNSRKWYILPAFIAVFTGNQGKMQDSAKIERNPENQEQTQKAPFQYKNNVK